MNPNTTLFLASIGKFVLILWAFVIVAVVGAAISPNPAVQPFTSTTLAQLLAFAFVFGTFMGILDGIHEIEKANNQHETAVC